MCHKTIALENLEIKIHPAFSKKIIINYPGYNGHIDGYNKKYVTLSDFLQEKNIGAVVRTDNIDPFKDFDAMKFGEYMLNKLRKVIEYSIENSKLICRSQIPKIYLMGFSAGAGAIAAVAHESQQVKKILLMAPSIDAGKKEIIKGLSRFKGEVYIVNGKNDDVVGPKAGQIFYDWAEGAVIKKIENIPNCDHQFRGEINGKIISKAPFWAFAGDETFPSPEGGIKLYD